MNIAQMHKQEQDTDYENIQGGLWPDKTTHSFQGGGGDFRKELQDSVATCAPCRGVESRRWGISGHPNSLSRIYIGQRGSREVGECRKEYPFS
jgi:hypothetical protein